VVTITIHDVHRIDLKPLDTAYSSRWRELTLYDKAGNALAVVVMFVDPNYAGA
jgi:hypothetical protein